MRERAISMVKGIGLYSGGLDSVLAIKLLLDQGCGVECIAFETPFFKPRAFDWPQVLELEHRFPVITNVDITNDFFAMLISPRYGYGKNMNPCIDCKILMLSEARKTMHEKGADFVFTGEVLGQRPMSQRRDTLDLIEKRSGLEGRLLRPLSAKLLRKTIPEERGLLDREKLLDISGRSRKRQLEMAKLMNWQDFPSPGGGCLLTDPCFARRLSSLLNKSIFRPDMIKWLKTGRHFDLAEHTWVIVGRDKRENNMLQEMAGIDEIIIRTVSVPGPVTVIIGEATQEIIDLAAAITVSYSDVKVGEESYICVVSADYRQERVAKSVSREAFTMYRI